MLPTVSQDLFTMPDIAIFTPDNCPMALFAMNDMGPEVIYHDFSLYFKEDISNEPIVEFLTKMAVNSIVTLGQGHEYCEGVFDLPASILDQFRLMVISFRIENMNAHDGRLRNGYYQIGLFIPKPLLQFLPSFVLFEKDLLTLVKSLISSRNFSEKRFKILKHEVLRILNSYCLHLETI